MLQDRKLTIDDLDIRDKQVLVRVDYNVPLHNGVIEDDNRIRATLPTLRKVLDDGGILVLISHCGRPNGRVDPSLSLAPVAKRLGELLGKHIKFVPDCVGEKAREARSKATRGDILLMENLRFHAEETDNDEDFARQLAEGADIYINEAFSTSHRAHASTVTITKFIEQAAAGYLLLHEIEIFENVLNNPNRPFVSIIGGIKVSTKIGVIENLLGVCDEILIGGAMACTFFESLGIMAGSSLCEHDQMDTARRILEKAGATEPKTGQLLLPLDAIVTDKISPDGKRVIASFDSIPEGMTVVDIGPDTIARFRKQIENAQTIIMNGPLGVFEIEQFSHGTREIFKMLVERAESGANVVIGGGDSAYAARKYGFDTHMTHVSTGGGASLKFLEGKPLPAVEALTEKS